MIVRKRENDVSADDVLRSVYDDDACRLHGAVSGPVCALGRRRRRGTAATGTSRVALKVTNNDTMRHFLHSSSQGLKKEV